MKNYAAISHVFNDNHNVINTTRTNYVYPIQTINQI